MHASGVDSDRILLFGSGPAVGWGVLSHDLALPGALARGVSALTGRGTDVDVVSEPDLRLANAIRELGAVDLTRYDGIVLTMGLMEAVGLASTASWLRDLDGLLSYLAEVAPKASIFVVGIHATTQITRYDAMVAPIIAHHRAALNRVSAQLSANSERVTFVPFEPEERIQQNRYRSKNEYREGGAYLAGWVAPVLDAAVLDAAVPDATVQDAAVQKAAHGSGSRRRPRQGGLDTLARRNAIDQFGILEATQDEAFARLTEFARRSLHARAANITIVGSDRFWTTASRGAAPTEGSSDDSICFTTIEYEDALVIADASRDPRFADMRRIQGPPPVRFYAGQRIDAPNGVPIGVLCVHDSVAHDVHTFDRALFRDIALLVQKEIWIASQATTPAGYTNRRVHMPVAIPVERTFAPTSSRR